MSVCCANWLYVARLDPPHKGNLWSAWYLSRIVRREGWSVLCCKNDNNEQPMAGMEVPGFALLARDGRAGGPQHPKEVLLLVRGSATCTDWKINLNFETKPIT